MALADADIDDTSLAHFKSSYVTDRVKLAKYLTSSGEKLAHAKSLTGRLVYTRDSSDRLMNNPNDIETKQCGYEKQSQFLEGKVSQQSKQLLEKCILQLSTRHPLLSLTRSCRIYLLNLDSILRSIQRRKIYLLVLLKHLLLTRRLHGSVPRLVTKTMGSCRPKRPSVKRNLARFRLRS